jgi:hypothetical protein
VADARGIARWRIGRWRFIHGHPRHIPWSYSVIFTRTRRILSSHAAGFSFVRAPDPAGLLDRYWSTDNTCLQLSAISPLRRSAMRQCEIGKSNSTEFPCISIFMMLKSNDFLKYTNTNKQDFDFVNIK